MQDQATPLPPAPPAPPALPGAAVTVEVPGAPSPSDVLQGLEARREKLQGQLRDVEGQRSQVVSNLRRASQGEGSGNEAVTKGLEARLAALDARVVSLDAEIAAADAAVAQAAAVPGAVIEVPPPPIIRHSGPDEDVVAIGGFFLTVLLMPLVIAYSRRLWRRGAAAAVSLPAELMQRLVRIEQGMDAMAIEVERISEGQRFVTRVFTESTERKALGAQVPAGEGAEDSLRRV